MFRRDALAVLLAASCWPASHNNERDGHWPAQPNLGGGGAESSVASAGGFAVPDPEPLSCPSLPLAECTTPVEPLRELWFDTASLDTPAHILGVSFSRVLLATAPTEGTSEPLLAQYDLSSALEVLPVVDPHEPALIGAAITGPFVVLCGATACRAYETTELGMADAQALTSP